MEASVALARSKMKYSGHNNKWFDHIFSRVLRDSTPRFVGPSVGPLLRHTLLFWRLWGFWPHCSCPNVSLTSIMAPAHPHAIGIRPCLFSNKMCWCYIRRRPSEANICVSKKVKMEKMNEWKYKNKWIKVTEIGQIEYSKEKFAFI